MGDDAIDPAESGDEVIKKGDGFPIFLRGDASEDQIAAFANEAWLLLQKLRVDEDKT